LAKEVMCPYCEAQYYQDEVHVCFAELQALSHDLAVAVDKLIGCAQRLLIYAERYGKIRKEALRG